MAEHEGAQEVHYLGRLLDAAENAAAELERLRILKEHELGLRVRETKTGDMWVEEAEF
jgi:hypothetical protein